jgi:hypothetical protein
MPRGTQDQKSTEAVSMTSPSSGQTDPLTDNQFLDLLRRAKPPADLADEPHGSSGEAQQSSKPATHVDPLEQAMKEHPGLTREKAERMAREFGY